MIITTFSYSRTAQPKQYESVNAEAQAVPGEGQNAVEAFSELVSFVNARVDEALRIARGGPASGNGGKPTKKNGPLLKPGQGGDNLSDPPLKSKSVEKAVEAGEPGDSEAPFDEGNKTTKPAKPKKTRGSKKAEMQAKLSAAVSLDAAHKEVQYVVDSQSVEELFERFNNLRDMGNGFAGALGVGEWEAAMGRVAARYRALDKMSVDQKILGGIADNFTQERKRVDDARNGMKNAFTAEWNYVCENKKAVA